MRSATLPAKWLRVDVLVLLLIFSAFYFYRLADFSLSIDDEFGAVGYSVNTWLNNGRWVVYLIYRYLLPQPVMPFLPVFLFGVFLSISYPVALSAFGVNRLGWIHYLAFPLYAAFPTWTFLACFAPNIAVAGAAQLLVACALRRYCRAAGFIGSGSQSLSKKRLANDVALGAVLLALVIGIYQSFLISFVVLSLMASMIGYLREPIGLKRVFLHGVLLVAIVLIAGVLYKIVDISLRHVIVLPDIGYLDAFLNWQALVDSPLAVMTGVKDQALDVYGGSASVYGLAAFGFPLVLCVGLLATATIPGLSRGQRGVSLLLAVVVLVLPFLPSLLHNGHMPLRTLVSLPSIVWVFAMIGMTSRRTWQAILALLAIVVCWFQMFYSFNLLQSANHFARIHDEALAAAIYARIADTDPAFSTDKVYKIDFFGAKRFQTIYPRPWTSESGYSFFEWDGGNIRRIVAYMHLIGYANIEAADQAQREADQAAFAQMPSWPARDSVRVVGDTTLVKLGPTRSAH